MKKLLIALLSLVLCFALCSCSNAKVDNETTNAKGEASTVAQNEEQTNINSTMADSPKESTIKKNNNQPKKETTTQTTSKKYIVEDETTTTKKHIDNNADNQSDVDNTRINAEDLL